jgi:hypothetical protein
MPADDSIFEKALERQMRKRPVAGIDGATQNAACPDAEWLAAYHERSLGDEEMVFWKEHIASCGRCQEVLAALETTEEISLGGEREGEFAEVADAFGGMPGQPAGPANARERFAPLASRSAAPVSVLSAPAQTARGASQKRGARSYWVVAAGTIATAAVLYVGVLALRHETPLETATTVETARTPGTAKPGVREEPQRSAQNVPPQNLPAERSRPMAPSVAERDLQSPRPARAPLSDAVTADLRGADKNGDLPPKQRAARSAGAAAAARGDRGRPEGDLTAGAAGSPAAGPPPAPPETNEEDAKKSAAAAAQETITVVNEAPPAPAGTPARSATVTSEKPASAPSQNKDEAQQTATALQVQSEYRAKAIGGSLGRSKESHLIAAPGGNVVWRVGAQGTIEQSMNAGATWTKQRSGVADQTLRSGSAPSETVCWVVGSAGTILRTVDGGGHWLAVVSPLGRGGATGDLGGVLGVDALHATVWDARNTQQFATSDGGQNWVPVAKQQK